MKIAFVGKICSGKTWCVNYLNDFRNTNKKNSEKPFYITRFAKMVKHIARELFFMRGKDRLLLQQIGTKMREINEDVYANYVINECYSHEFCLLDDARYENEILLLKDNGWTIVKLDISSELQKKRIMSCYPDTYLEHLSRLSHESETQQDTIPDYMFDFRINIDKEDVNKSLISIYNRCLR